jgi:2-polyprenyl-3-methyl-5-hydroxy-6-metoxy-1,4-benzoquinol methylase
LIFVSKLRHDQFSYSEIAQECHTMGAVVVLENIRIEDGLVIGTAGDKYHSKNPIARYLVREFDRAISELAAQVAPKTIVEYGCGEGHVVELLLKATNARIHATDISPTCIAEAQSYVSSDRVTFAVENIMTMKISVALPTDLVVCCEVLEHLDDPQRGFEVLLALKAKHYLFSVPREPLWRMLNFSRGAYIKQWGNSPGHLQHWSKRAFLNFISRKMSVITVRSPVPWTVVLCQPNEC